MDYGRLVRTTFVLRYLADEALQRRVHQQLNKGKSLFTPPAWPWPRSAPWAGPPPAPRPRGGEPGPGALMDQVPLDYVDSSAHASPITRCVPYGDPRTDTTSASSTCSPGSDLHRRHLRQAPLAVPTVQIMNYLQVPRDRNGSFDPKIVRKGPDQAERVSMRVLALRRCDRAPRIGGSPRPSIGPREAAGPAIIRASARSADTRRNRRGLVEGDSGQW